MTNKELRRLGRRDLLEMLIEQTKELNQIKMELSKAREALNERRILLAESGSIAEAALKLTKVFETAQEAADLYLDSIRYSQGSDEALPQKPGTETSEALLEKTRRECDAMRTRTEAECEALREATQKNCAKMVALTKQRCREYAAGSQKE